jgi:hypothetical protein
MIQLAMTKTSPKFPKIGDMTEISECGRRGEFRERRTLGSFDGKVVLENLDGYRLIRTID